MMKMLVGLLLLLSGAAGVEHCSAYGECEQMRFPADYEPDVFLASANPEPRDVLEELAGESVKEMKYMRSRPQDRKSKGGSMGAKFRNFQRSMVETRWDDGSKEGVYSGDLESMGRTSTLTYIGHTFFFVDKTTKKEVARFLMTAGVNIYVIEPTEGDNETLTSDLYTEAKAEQDFMAEYEAENGIPWLSSYGRGPPGHHMWPAESVGQTHVVATKHTHHTSLEETLAGDLAVNLRVVSHPPAGPRVFLVKNLLSQFECDHITELGETVVKRSMVGTGGGFQSKTRSSLNGWLKHEVAPVLARVHRRFADVLGLDFKKFKKIAEDLQVVKYDIAQEYAPHHDFGDDGTPEQRFLTLLLYIQLPEEGGATSFPKAFDGRGIQIVPERGDAILFYNMLPDGNADDLALHAGMPVSRGQKWVCNLWIWDPFR